MELQEISPIPTAALPVAAFRDHLRLSSGFSDDTTQDALLVQYLRAAIAQVEGRVSRALFARAYSLRLGAWGDDHAQRLPVAPVTELTSMTLIAANGTQTVVAPARYELQADGLRPRVAATGTALPTIPSGGAVVLEFTAGFGPAWDDIPADLRQAVLLLAAQYYEGREGGDDLSFGIRALLERWRDIRMGGRA